MGAATGRAGRSWALRRRRAFQLREKSPHARELLTLYGELLIVQEPLYDRAARGEWKVPRSRSLDLGLLPLGDMAPAFADFVSDLRPRLTDVLRSAGDSLSEAGGSALRDVLEIYVAAGDLAALSGSIECEPLQLEFFARTFLQPIAEALAGFAKEESDTELWYESTCPRCGHLPQVGVLRDEPEVRNRRLLVCSLCAGWWPFQRLTCAGCGEQQADQLLYHESDSLGHVRIEECLSCKTYLKSIDLRKDGAAVPEVDDVASVELDLWARERGLRKMQLNLLGF